MFLITKINVMSQCRGNPNHSFNSCSNIILIKWKEISFHNVRHEHGSSPSKLKGYNSSFIVTYNIYY